MVELTKAAVLKKLKTVAGFKELTNKQMMTRLASLAQNSVKNALRAAKFKGGAVGVALTVLGMGAETALSKNQKARNRRKNIDPSAGKPDELQTEPMDSSKNRYLGPATKSKPKPMTDKQKIAKLKSELATANAERKAEKNKPIDKRVPGVKKSLRPKTRPNNLKDGGMPMVMKDGKKVPAYAADGIGKMNKGGMAMKKKPTTKMMAGGMAAKKKPAAKKMMAGGMAKKKMMAGGMTKSNYMYGGMAKKPKAKK